jgi:hypothetical protein
MGSIMLALRMYTFVVFSIAWGASMLSRTSTATTTRSGVEGSWITLMAGVNAG